MNIHKACAYCDEEGHFSDICEKRIADEKRCEHNCIRGKCVYNDCSDEEDNAYQFHQVLLDHMNIWRKQNKNDFKDAETFWKHFFEELKGELLYEDAWRKIKCDDDCCENGSCECESCLDE